MPTSKSDTVQKSVVELTDEIQRIGKIVSWDNVFINVFSSVIFLLLILLLCRPKLKISEEIAKEVEKDGKIVYRFKLVNWSFFSAFDIYINLDQRNLIALKGSKFDEDLTNIQLYRSHFSTLPSWKFIDRERTAAHALQIRTYENLSDILGNRDKSLLLQITLKHGLTGLSRSYERYFYKGCICEGRFKNGFKMGVNPE